jgi:anti-sigma-K factor RskA
MNTDVKEYIASGILEAYVLGTLEEKERQEVEAMASKHPEVKKELDAIEDALITYATMHSMDTSSGLKEKVMSKINEGGGKAEYDRPVINMNRMEAEEKADPRNKAIWGIAASVLLMISLMANLYTYQRMERAEGYVHELAAKSLKKDSVIKLAVANLNQLQSDMAILKDPMYKIVELKGQPKAPDAKAMVCFCPGSKLVYFEADKMPEPPKGMQYQLWAIVDGKPVDEGMITMGPGLHKMKDIDQATAFAVTLEKEGNGATPHGDMIVLGSMPS